MTKDHTEAAFEAEIVAHLTQHGGYVEGTTALFDRQRAIIADDVLAFVEATQPKVLTRLGTLHKDPEKDLVQALCNEMDKNGSLHVLRHGFKLSGVALRFAQFAPSHGLNPDVTVAYEANVLRVVRQLKYDPSNENALDLVLFVNGVPVVTAELKNPMTGQSASYHAQKQYREARDPDAPIFRFKQRALVHFAIDPDDAWMTTRLARESTHFLPFNRGNGTGKGNPLPPDGADKNRTFYVWEHVWQRDSLLDLLGAFLHFEKPNKDDKTTGKKTVKETLIFPRFHQWDCVRKVVSTAKAKGAGSNYLIQHSAGSGKSNTIAWLAHRLAGLYDAKDEKVYHSVIVVTDRVVLDQQLQNTIFQFEHKWGVVECIDKDSAQLAHALSTGTPIIITTLHKFGFLQDKIAGLPDRRYAIIVDEAHSSQSGDMAVSMKEVLAESAVQQKLHKKLQEADEDGDDLSTPDQLALRAALYRGPQPNLSFFAFTATPKGKTLKLFGHTGPDGKPIPFHLYSMRQAIEEEFILDVLRGYTTYKRFHSLVKVIADDPEVEKKKAAKALARFVNLHPTNLAAKTEIIIEHFRGTVRHLLNGKAKAMVVTDSRLMAVRYRQAFDAYIKTRGYTDVRCLVAFSGEVEDDEVEGVTYSEVEMNGGIKEKELPEKFASDDYNLLLVANKYQTGFDQPLLVVMYVDKRLDGIQAVQTLSRLNRKAPGKKQTFVLDFVNKRDTIQAAFQDYFEGAFIGEDADPQKLHQLQGELDATGVYWQTEVDKFAGLFFKLTPDQVTLAHGGLNSALNPAVERFKSLPEDKRDEFRGKLSAFKNLYAFLAQVIEWQDAALEKLYVFGRMLLSKLPATGSGGGLDLDEEVALKSYKLRQLEPKALELNSGDGKGLDLPVETGTRKPEPDLERLSTIIEVLNKRFQTDYETQGLVEEVKAGLEADTKLQKAAAANPMDAFGLIFEPALVDALVEKHDTNGKFVETVLTPGSPIGQFFKALMLEAVYSTLKAKAGG
ncbi:DEAD/DEAH box helicase family protein [Myxococcota bacterium]|nr:DEAD/DEAH box helicase family protein [Myxococcota bacterium]